MAIYAKPLASGEVEGFLDETDLPGDGWVLVTGGWPLPARPNADARPFITDGVARWDDPRSLADQQAAMWERIKEKRDTIKRGGVLVDGSWFHSDDSSRIQQLGLVMMGANVPAVQWKTMSGAFVTMTQTLASAIFNAVASLDQNAFANAEQHRAAMMASAAPSAYDYSTGWPQVYADTLTT